MNLIVRPVREHDYQALRAVDEAALLPGSRVTSGENRPAPRAITPDEFAFVLEAGCSYLAEVDGVPAGFLLAQPIAYHDHAPLTLWVEGIAVHPAYRRRRIGTALYDAFGDWARAVGVRAVLARLDLDDAAALALHRRVGFEAHTADTVIWRLDQG